MLLVAGDLVFSLIKIVRFGKEKLNVNISCPRVFVSCNLR